MALAKKFNEGCYKNAVERPNRYRKEIKKVRWELANQAGKIRVQDEQKSFI